MPSDVTATTPAGGRQFAGQPWWIWAAGGVALVGGYIILRRKGTGQQQPAGTTTQPAAGSPTGLSWEQFLLFIHDQQSSPAKPPVSQPPVVKPRPAPKPKPKRKPRPGPKPKPRGMR